MILYSIISKQNTQNQIMENYSNPLIPSSTYYGWYSEAVQCLRICNPTEHPYKNKGIKLTSPPYTYWKQGEKLVLVTEITNTAFPTPRQVKNGDIFLGPIDSYHGRSYRRLSDKDKDTRAASAFT